MCRRICVKKKLQPAIPSWPLSCSHYSALNTGFQVVLIPLMRNFSDNRLQRATANRYIITPPDLTFGAAASATADPLSSASRRGDLRRTVGRAVESTGRGSMHENGTTYVLAIWGCSSVGRALEWHSRGRRFDPDQLHQIPAIRAKVKFTVYLLIKPATLSGCSASLAAAGR